MGFKNERLGPRLVAAARSGERNRDAHLFLGGTGAVGGTALLQMLSIYEELFAIASPGADDVPVLVATGTTREEIAAFTRRLFRWVESRHGSALLPTRVRNGYLTHSGVFVALERFSVSPIPELTRIGDVAVEERGDAVARFLSSIGAREGDAGSALEALARAVSSSRPFREFLARYRDQRLLPLGIERFRSVVLGIPIPSLVAYHGDELLDVASRVPGLGADEVEALKERFVEAIRDDLVEVKESLADDVLIAHTTGVGGMFDDAPEGSSARPTIRLAFAHAAQDERLADKARFASRLTELYSAAGLKVLITAAAIGIDEVRVHERVPLHRAIRARLESAAVLASSSQFVRVHRPLTVPLAGAPSDEVAFDRGEDVVPSYAIRSGENGFFSVANADALYRVMRVASASELGLLLATVALLGDDRSRPWFRDNVCFYAETDNARQVLDFLAQPPLRASELSGLDPMALQDLGSAKHQGELHTLGLLILLHRLRTLDVDAIDPYVDLAGFDPARFLVEHSRTLTFEDLVAWDFDALARDAATLAAADAPEDLVTITPSRDTSLFPLRREAVRRVLERALRAVWTPPSLGSPLVYEAEGTAWLRTGAFVAPLDVVVTSTDAVDAWLRARHGGPARASSFEDVRDYHLAVGGFVDLRPHAIVCAARTDEGDLTGRVARFTDEASLREHLRALEPYSFFSTCGLLAVWFRLRALYGLLRESMLELGTLHEFRWAMPRDAGGHLVVVPGVVEALRMVSEGLEKTTGTERLDGIWGYERCPVPDRREQIPGLRRD